MLNRVDLWLARNHLAILVWLISLIIVMACYLIPPGH